MHSQNHRLLTLALLITLVTSMLPAPAAGSSINSLLNPDEECDVTTGESIQQAIDNATTYTRIIVCEATYHETVTIGTDGIELVGKGTPILDGSLDTGTRHGITLASGVQDIAVANFEIRNYDDGLNGTDNSTGILAEASTTNITLVNNTIHHNAWAGVVAANGTHQDWLVWGNKFDDHAFAHTFLQHVTNLRFEANDAASSADQAFIFASLQTAYVANNTVHGGGNGALTLTPSLDTTSWNYDVTLHNNTVDGKWTHGIWALALHNSRITNNTLTNTGTHLTLGGDPEEITLEGNNASLAFETKNISQAVETFQHGAPDNTTTQSRSTSPTPSLLTRVLGWFTSVLDYLFPSAQASVSLDCDLDTECTTSEVEDLFDYALLQALNPREDPKNSEDIQRLQACEGKGDACLRSEFFPHDANPTNGWNVTLASGATLRFLDAGTRRPSEVNFTRHERTDLEGNWTTGVLCRLEVDGATYPCLSEPRLFDYGLDVTWAPTNLPRHVSKWRMFLPTNSVHASFDRVHGPDATLFKLTDEAHHADSPSVTSATNLTPDPVQDPHRVETAGRLDLKCSIATSTGSTSDCNTPTLLTEELPQATLAWCDGYRDVHTGGLHESLTQEVLSLWRWSGSCQDANTTLPEANWTPLFRDLDLRDLAQAHEDYYNATTTTNRTAALQAAEAVFERVAARHLSLQVEGHGAPVSFNASTLDEVLPTKVAELPRDTRAGTAVWTGSDALLFEGTYGQKPLMTINPDFKRGTGVVRYDPSTNEIENEDPFLNVYPAPVCCMSSFWDGNHTYLASGRTNQQLDLFDSWFDSWTDGATEAPENWWNPRHPLPNKLPTIMQFQRDPAGGADTITLAGLLPEGEENTAAVWDGRDLPSIGCPQGCAYIFIQGQNVVQFNPVTGTTTTKSTALPWTPGGLSSVWTGEEAIIFYDDRTQIIHYDPLWDEFDVATPSFSNSWKGAQATAAWDGENAYVFGWSDGDGSADEIYRYDPETHTLQVLEENLPEPHPGASAVWTGDRFLIFGGGAPSTSSSTGFSAGPQRSILEYKPAHNAPELVNETVKSASSFDMVGFAAASSAASNIDLVQAEVRDQGSTWHPMKRGELAAFTPVRLTYNLTYEAVNGDIFQDQVQLVVNSTSVNVTLPPLLVEYGNHTYTSVGATDTDNRNYTSDYLNLSDKRMHSLPVVNTTTNTTQHDVLANGGVELPLNPGNLTTCVRELWTAQASGEASNLDPDTRLAVQPEGQTSCRTWPNLDSLKLAYQAPTSLTLELRGGNDITTRIQRVDDPSVHITDHTDSTANRTLADARTAQNPDAWTAAVEPVTLRIVVTLPHDMPSTEKAHALATLLNTYRGVVGTFAVEIDNLPLPSRLNSAVNTAIQDHGTVVLAPAGTLPSSVTGWHARDKLMTIHGLAAHPQVITVGAATLDEGIAPWSRRGPTPALTPKPDLAAPSPNGTTAGAVSHVLPFVEALAVRGVQEANLVRVVLSGYALPAATEDNTPATYWEQGLGVVDLTAFLSVSHTTTQLLDDSAARQGITRTKLVENLALEYNTTTSHINNSTPAQVLALAEHPAPLVRAGVSASLVNLTLDSPALPHTLVSDFGLVNHNETGRAYFAPVDLDPLVQATLNNTRLLLEQAGYTSTELDTIMPDLRALMQDVVDDGQEVTINTTHYRLFEALENDLLYSGYDTLLTHASENHDQPPGVTSSDVDSTRNALSEWQLQPHHLVPEVHGNATLEVTTDEQCVATALEATVSTGDTVLRILRNEATLLATQTNSPALKNYMNTLPMDTRSILADGNQGYLLSQGKQAACLADQREALEFLRGEARELRELKRIPPGAWNATEAEDGTWDRTALGENIEATAPVAGFNASTVAANTTLVLDLVLEVLDRSLTLLQEKLNLTHVPTVDAGEPASRAQGEDVTILETDPQRTREARLGPYVGFTTLTSHDVVARDPVKDVNVSRRDITIPLPSFLWNNPSLNWTEAYRDGSRDTNASVTLTLRSPDIFQNLTHEAWRQVNSSTIPLEAHPTNLYEGERAQLREDLDTVQAWLGNEAAQSSLGVFEERVVHEFKAANDTLSSWNASATCDTLGSLTDRASCNADYWDTALNSLLTGLYSHVPTHGNLTNATGQAGFGNLFPGAYSPYMPYPYHTLARMDQSYPYAAPGEGGLAGSMRDLDWTLQREAHASENLPLHPSARDATRAPASSPEGVAITPGGWDWSPVYEVHSSESVGPFHQFKLALDGVDLTGVVCLETRHFAQATGTPLNYPGCGLPGLSQEQRRNLTRARDLAACSLGNGHGALPSSYVGACDALRERFEDARRDCVDHGRCQEWESQESLRDALGNLTRSLGFLLEPRNEVLVPWARSPTRALDDHGEELGYTQEEVFERAQNVSSNTASTEQLWNDTATAVRELTQTARTTTSVADPARVSGYHHVVAQGLRHHVTDRVSGLDWFHVGTRGGEPVPTGDKVSRQVLESRDMLNDSSLYSDDRDRLQALEEWAKDQTNQENATDAFNDGLALTATQRAKLHKEGWHPNGTVTLGGLNLTSDNPVQEKMWNEKKVCSRKENVTGTPKAYHVCEAIKGETRPTVHGLGHIDTVQFTNVLLEEMRRHYPDASNLPDSLPNSVGENVTRKAAALASVEKNLSLNRSETGILVEPANATPAVGMMVYNTPVPPQEWVQYRVDGEFLLQNTAGLLITTGNPLVTEAIMGALDTVNLTTGNASAAESMGRVVTHLDDAVVDNLEHPGEPLLRVDPIGLPANIEQTSSLPKAPNLGGWSDALNGTNPAATMDPKECQTTLNQSESLTLCEQGLATVQPDGYHNYSVTHEWDTKYRTRGQGIGVRELTTIFVYFPGLTQGSPTIPQKVAVRNLSIQLNTFVGIATSNDDKARGYTLDERVGWRANVEDWKQLWAVPDQPLYDPATNTGINVSFNLGGAVHETTPNELVQGLGEAHAAPGVVAARCPVSAAPGFPTTAYNAPARGLPGGPNHLYSGTQQPCLENDVEALRPVHRLGAFNGSAAMTRPDKRVQDGLQYAYHVGALEEFSRQDRARPTMAGDVSTNPANEGSMLFDKYGRLKTPPTSPPELTTRVDKALTTALGTASEGVQNLHGPLVNLTEALPMSNQSFLPAEQAPAVVDPRVNRTTLHNYAVLTEDDLRDLFSESGEDKWNANTNLGRRDETSSPASTVHDPKNASVPAQSLPLRLDPDYRSGVVAHRVVADVTQDGDTGGSTSNHVRAVSEVLVGHGVTGTGMAMRVASLSPATTSDWSQESLLRNHSAGAGTVFWVEAYNLGGWTTVGSDCGRVPLYDYVEPYFRCTGYNHTGAIVQIGGSAGMTDCYGEAQTFVDHATDIAVDTGTRDARSWFRDTTPAGQALESLSSTSGTGPVGLSGLALAERAREDVSKQGALTEDAAQLAMCVQANAWGSPGAFPNVDLSYVVDRVNESVQAGLDEAKAKSTSKGTVDSVEELEPGLFAKGEPPHAVDVGLLLDQATRVRGATNETGRVFVPYAVEEWQSRFQGGWLNLTTGTGSSATTATLAHAPSTATAVNATLDVPHSLPNATRKVPSVWNGQHVYVFGTHDSTEIYRYDPGTGSTDVMNATLPYKGLGVSGVWTGEAFYLFGGVGKDAIHRYDPGTDTLTTVTATLPGNRMRTAAVWTGTHALVLGGSYYDGSEWREVNEIVRYNPRTDEAHLLSVGLVHEVDDASAVWTGDAALVFGGSGNDGDTSAIQRYRPSVHDVDVPAHLPTARDGTAAVYDGERAYVLGGHDGTYLDEIVAYNASTHGVEVLGLTLEQPRWMPSAAWNGTHGLVFGGRNGNGTLSGVAHFRPGGVPDSVLRVNTPGTVSRGLDHGTTYTWSLTATDEFGVVDADEVPVLVDNVLPTLSLDLPSVHYTNQDSITLHWNATDTTSGLWNVSLRNTTDNVTWTPTGNLLSTEEQGVTTETSFNHPLDLSGLVTGEKQVVRVTVEDRAGNVVSRSLKVEVDRALPDVLGDIVNEDSTSLVKEASLNTTNRVWDNASGLQELRVWTYDDNTTTERELLHDTGMAGVGDTNQMWLNHSQPQPNATHTLNVTAVDRAGNVNTTTLDLAEVQIWPLLEGIIPRYDYQVGEENLTLRSRVWVPGYPNETTEHTNLTIRNKNNASQVWTFDKGQALGNLSQWWESEVSQPASFHVSYRSEFGSQGVTFLNHTLNVTLPYHSAKNLSTGSTYGVLNGSSDTDLYRVTHPDGCGDYFNLRISSMNDPDHDTDFYVNQSKPEETGTDPSQYTWAHNSSDDYEYFERGNVTAGTVFSFLVTHKNATASDYWVYYYVDCGGGSDGGDIEDPTGPRKLN